MCRLISTINGSQFVISQTLGTDVCNLVYDMRMDETTSSFILHMHREHMIEQEGNMDGLGMLDFMGFQKSCSILWSNTKHDFTKI